MEDLVQEAFLETFRSLPRFRGESQLSTWISRITSRVAFAYLSRKKPAAAPLDLVPDTAGNGPNPDSQVSARIATQRLYVALDKLDPKQRIAFALHVIDGRSMKEVAEVMGASLVATKSRVWRARREIEKRAKRDPLLSNYLAAQEGLQ
jgi:RNA polymerase sigma-70 factor (ECF subfamily)